MRDLDGLAAHEPSWSVVFAFESARIARQDVVSHAARAARICARARTRCKSRARAAGPLHATRRGVKTKRRIALVSRERELRTKLALYLRSAGFEVHESDELALPSSFTALVLIFEHDLNGDMLQATVRSWLKLTKAQRVVVVTWKPAALESLAAAHERLFVLAAPVFGWQIVDVLRAVRGPLRPRTA